MQITVHRNQLHPCQFMSAPAVTDASRNSSYGARGNEDESHEVAGRESGGWYGYLYAGPKGFSLLCALPLLHSHVLWPVKMFAPVSEQL